MSSDDDLARYRDAIAAVESAGSGDYAAIGPVTKSGDRAYGRYQVMGSNIPAWTKAAFGTSLTPEQFQADPDAQDAVFNHHFGGYVSKYGNPQDAASAWFSGRPLSKGSNASDGYITGKEYVKRFNGALAFADENGGTRQMVDDRDDILKRYNSVSQPADNAATVPDDREDILSRYSTKPPEGSPQGRIDQGFSALPQGQPNQPITGQVPVKSSISTDDVLPELAGVSKDFYQHYPEVAGAVAAGGLALAGPRNILRGIQTGVRMTAPVAKILGLAEAYKHGDDILHFLLHAVP